MSQRKQTTKLQPFDASAYRVAIVVADFNADITEELLASALRAAKQYKIPAKNIAVYHVAGSVEIPVILKALADGHAPGGGRYDALVALGTIIRGETPHFEYVAKIVSDGILAVMLDDIAMPVGFGVLTCENLEQAKARLHFGGEALVAALHNAKIISSLNE